MAPENHIGEWFEKNKDHPIDLLHKKLKVTLNLLSGSSWYQVIHRPCG